MYTQHMLILLMLLTAGLLVWHHYGMNRDYAISAASGHEILVADDRISQGASVAVLERHGKVMRMRCHLQRQFPWPFCRYTFTLGPDGKGMDLSQFNTVEFNVRASGTMRPESGTRYLLANFLNHEPDLASGDYAKSHKVNEVQFEAPPDGRLVLPLNVIETASWWKTQYRIPLVRTNTQLDNVTVVELATAGNEPDGDIVVDFESIIFHGKWISQTRLLMWIVGAWFGCALVWSAASANQYRLELKKSKARYDLLAEINRALELETKELAGQAHTDPLTGVLNRQGLRAVLMSTSSLLTQPMSVVFADLDHFKRINDTYGHDAGDDVLREFVSAIGGVLRATDKVVRWGGEEFLVVCPNTTAEQARTLAEKLKATLGARSWPCNHTVTASFGIASASPGEDIGATIKRADMALYRAKDNGRNRVEVAG